MLTLFVNTLTEDKSIPVAICRFSRNKVKRHYLKKKRHFLDFLLHFWNVHEIWNISKKKDAYSSLIISQIIDSKIGFYLNV